MSSNNLPEIPPDLKYAKSHEWAKLVEGNVVVGITAYAVEEMGRDIVHIELPPAGDAVSQAESFGMIDSVKAAFDLYAPISGEVIESNDAATQDPSLIAQSPYEKGWLIKIAPRSIAELDTLLNAEAYRGLISAGDASH